MTFTQAVPFFSELYIPCNVRTGSVQFQYSYLITLQACQCLNTILPIAIFIHCNKNETHK